MLFTTDCVFAICNNKSASQLKTDKFATSQFVWVSNVVDEKLMTTCYMIGTVKEFSFWNVTYSNNIVGHNLEVVRSLMSISWLGPGRDDNSALLDLLLLKRLTGHGEVGDQSVVAAEDGDNLPHEIGQCSLLWS